MANLKKRIEALEAQSSAGGDAVALLLRGVAPGHLDAEIDALQSLDGLSTWKRRPSETEQAFKDRASRDACKAAGVTLLVATMRAWTVPGGEGV